jgi:hypothetical protein
MSKTSPGQTGRREFLKHTSFATAAGLLGLGLRAEAWTNHPHHHGAAPDAPETHNMLIVGRQAVFLSHLPMFSTRSDVSPHRFQVILEAAFTKEGEEPQAVYDADRRTHPAVKIYTLNPDKFVLSSLRPADGGAPLGSFGAQIFRGHLERSETSVIASDVKVDVRNVVHFREFDPRAARPARLEYILFGKGPELFLAHFITRPPDFDQVLAVSAAGHSFTDEELGRGMRVSFERPNSIARRLGEAQEAVGEVRAAAGAGAPLKVRFKAGTELYFEESELRVPASLAQTPVEIRAGFKP